MTAILKNEYSSANCLMTKFREQKRLNQISKVEECLIKWDLRKMVKYWLNIKLIKLNLTKRLEENELKSLYLL